MSRCTLLVALLLVGGHAGAQLVEAPLPSVDWRQELGAEVPLDARFTRSDGRDVRVSDLLDGRPAVLALVYHECPMLCNLVLSGLVASLKGMSLEVGDEFDVVVLSIDPSETAELAGARRAGWIERYGKGDGDGWHFLVGDETNVRTVADAVGFEYALVPGTDEYAHAAGLCVLTPGGVVSRIFYGTEFAPRDLKFSLMEASDGTIGTPIEKFVLRCFTYDPARGVYGFAILRALRAGGILTLLVLLAFVVTALRRERRAARLARLEGGSA